MAESVGQIGLDLVINQNQFNRQMSNISGLAKKAGAALAGAFAVKKIVDFGAECVKLGSDLQEVQNVVDVTFPKMKSQVNTFAQNAAASFGLSETMAKKFTGTFGAMANSFGFTEKKSYKMSTALTGLAGDVASFYNLSQDEAYTKLKSVFTGETETLKDLGVVMTQTALDSYALANGYGKVTSKMTEQEKVALRFKFVTEQLTAASGDFLRTSDSWANQTRLLSLQFDSLKASIGQGLINVLTPVIKVINSILQKLAVLGAKFAELTGNTFGNQDASGTAAAVQDVSNAASDASSNVAGIGTAAKKSAKEAQRATMSFDKFNKLSTSSSDSSGVGGTGGGATTAGESKDKPDAKNVAKVSGGALDGLKKKFEKVKSLFVKGFTLGAGNLNSGIESIKKHLQGIGDSLKDIFTDKKVAAAFKKLISLLILNAGKIVGALASIGVTIADNLIGGFDMFLSQNKERIKQWLINIFDIAGEISTIQADFWAAVAEIFEVFRSADAKQITSDLFNMVYTVFAGTTELFLKIGRDILNLLTKPIIDNKDKIKTVLENTIKPVSEIIHKIATVVQETFDKIQTAYDTHAKPLFDSLADGLSEIVGTICDGYNKYIAPVLSRLAEKFSSVMDSKIRPAIDNVIDLFGNFCDAVKAVWEKWIQPFINWCAENVIPKFAKVFETAGTLVMGVFGAIGDIIGGVAKVFSGLCKIIKGIAEGNWSAVWQGVRDIISGILKAIQGIFSAAWNGIKLVFLPVKTFFQGVCGGIKAAFDGIKGWFGALFTGAWAKIKSAFSLGNVKAFFSSVWSGITGAFGNVADWFETKFSNAWQKVKDVFSAGGKVFSGIKDGIASVFKVIVNTLITGINKIIATPFNKINGILNDIHDISVLGQKPFSGLWDKSPLPVPQIPKLATGGYVKANTPQLAMIGDNRHQGEVVAPEDKMLDMARQAAEMSGSNSMTSKVVDLLSQILSILESLNLCVYLDGEKITKNTVNTINRHTRQTGRLEIVVR